MMSFIIKKPIAPPSIPEIVNNLTSDAIDKTLSAAQGKALAQAMPSIPEIVNNLASDATDKTLAAAQGKALAQTIAGLNNLSLSTVINTIYPIGSIIELSNYLDPNTVFTGTTWAEYGQGRVTVAQGDDFATLGAIGGQKSVKMTANMLIAHSHGAAIMTGSLGNLGTGGGSDSLPASGSTTSAGLADPEPIPTMPPYIVVKRWRRTA